MSREYATVDRRYAAAVGLKFDQSANFFTLLAVLSRFLCSEDSFKSVCIRIFSVRNYLSPQRLLPRTAPIIVFIITAGSYIRIVVLT